MSDRRVIAFGYAGKRIALTHGVPTHRSLFGLGLLNGLDADDVLVFLRLTGRKINDFFGVDGIAEEACLKMQSMISSGLMALPRKRVSKCNQ